jgi:hypothetical protein
MKRVVIIIIGLFAAFGSIAQETKPDLKTRFDVIRNETAAGGNTKTRLANAYQELADGTISIFPVIASGTDTYTGTLQGLDAYSGRIVFVVFLNNNTGASTLNIGSIGTSNIEKYDAGWTALEADDIIAGKLYGLYHDGTRFQIDLGGSGGAGLVDGDYGDITVGGTGTTMAIDNLAVTNAKINDVAVGKITGLGTGVATLLATPSSANLASAITDETGSGGSVVFATGPTLSNPIVGTQSANDNSTKAASTAYADAKVADAINNGTTAIAPSQNAVFDYNAPYVLDRATPSTSGGTITLDMNSQKQRMHVGSATFATAKVIALSNTTNSLVFQFSFTITNVAAVLTMPSDFVMADPAFNGTDWTPAQIGNYEMGGSFDGTNWLVKIAGPFN